MKLVTIGMLLVLLIRGLNAEAIALPDVSTPHYFSVDKDQFYICQKENICIYSLKNFKLKKKFGGIGEGPGEFKSAPKANTQTNRLLIRSLDKLSVFSKEGELINEIKTTEFVIGEMMPLEDHYVGMKWNLNRTPKSAKNLNSSYALYLYNSKLEKVRKAFDVEKSKRMYSYLEETFMFQTNGKHLFVVRGKDLNIEVFDKNINQLYSIFREYKFVKCTEDRKTKILKTLDTPKKGSERFYRKTKKRAFFPEYFRAIHEFFVADGKVYVQTYRGEGDKREFLIFEEKGKYLKSVYLPGVCEKLLGVRLYTIRNNKLYYLIDNVEEEMWELHVVDIE